MSGLGDEDGTYEETSTDDDYYFYYKAGGTTFFEIHLFTNSDNAGWYIMSGNNVVYRVSELWRLVEVAVSRNRIQRAWNGRFQLALCCVTPPSLCD